MWHMGTAAMIWQPSAKFMPALTKMVISKDNWQLFSHSWIWYSQLEIIPKKGQENSRNFPTIMKMKNGRLLIISSIQDYHQN